MASRVLNILLRTSKQPATKSFGYKCTSRSKSSPISCRSHTRGVRSSSCSYRDEVTEDDERAALGKEPATAKSQQEPLERLSDVKLENEGPTTVRSTLPINILQTGSQIEESRLMESLVLGPNQRLAVPWPSYSENVIVKKPRDIVYPSLPDVTKSSSKTDTRAASLDLQKRGISRLHGVPAQEDMTSRPPIQNSSAATLNGCSVKIFGETSARWSSSYSDRPECQTPKKTREEPEICKASIKKSIRPKRKTLPLIRASDCPCAESTPMTSLEFSRLKKRYTYPDPVRICRTYTCADNLIPRADAGLRVRRKDLPSITPGDCPCAEKSMKDAPKLNRPKFRPVKAPKRICYTEAAYCATIPRADKDDWEYVYPKSCYPDKRDDDDEDK